MAAPVWWPAITALGQPRAASTSWAASAHVAIESAPAGNGSESPKPTVSMAMARWRLPSSGSTSRYSSQERGVWCSNRMGRPAPQAAMWTRPELMGTKDRSIAWVITGKAEHKEKGMKHSIAAALIAASLGIGTARAEITVGFVTSQSGPGSSIGVLYDRGMKAAVEYASSIGEEKVKLIQLDDASDPSAATRNARKLIEENKVDLVIGTATAASTSAMV